ncbi:MAG TPA: YciI family protein [Micromonosporaceae bacterium]|nr:YciI family protein [Micromonosporaceae bacterium]
MRYVMMICGEESNWTADPAKAAAAMAEVNAWFDKWYTAGKIAQGGAELDSVRTAKTVSRGPDGTPVVTDGPYLELKEVVGGFIHLVADNIEEAVAIAAGWPGIALGDKIEVRPVIER